MTDMHDIQMLATQSALDALLKCYPEFRRLSDRKMTELVRFLSDIVEAETK